jgi:predicted transcriptional regulator
MEELGEVLFLLSSTDRMRLLTEIHGGDLRLTDLAARLSASPQETSKHLGRLTDGGLIEKKPSGSYSLTSFGIVVFDLLPSLRFVSQHKKYFLSHDISSLPQEFILRIGDLSEHNYVEHVTNVIVECQHLLGMAEEYFYWVVDQPLPWSISKPFPESMSIKAILQTDVSPQAYKLARSMLGARAEVRFADRVKVSFAVNEKMGGIAFPDAEGKTDFSCGFIGYGPSFQRWCSDLFGHFWENSRKSWPGQLERKESSEEKVALGPGARPPLALKK